MSITRNETMAYLRRFIANRRASLPPDRREAGEADAIRAEFPSIPLLLVYELITHLDMEETEAWWQSVEKTIDGEIINRALTGAIH